MALALRTAAPLKPEIRLAQALSEFEAVLHDDEKKLFRTWRAGSPPSVSDVMKLTAEIDKDNRLCFGRCFGPRLTSILETVQQFSSIVDVIVGGSQSPIATSIWGVLRMTLQITVKFASYFDNLSALFMRIGRSCPRYGQYGVMYTKSQRLQEALCDYFCIVVTVCKKAVLFIRKSPIAQLSAAILKPFQSEFGPLESNLETIADAIREEASLAFKQEVALEKKEASRFRAWSSLKTATEIQEAKKFKAQKEKYRFLNACSTYNHQAAWKRARKMGESTRVFDHTDYKHWIQASTSSVLWITGILGSGKTVITASLVQEVRIQFPNALLGYFFCSHDDAESLQAKTILGSLARQLLSLLSPDTFASIDTVESDPFDNDEIVSYLHKLAPQNEQAFVIIDGLDECPEIELDKLFSYLPKFLQTSQLFHIFCSSRPDLHTRYRASLPSQHHLPLPVENHEIAQYIDSALEDRLTTGSLCLGDPAIILAIRQALVEGSRGMFLWVVFQLESICAELTDEAILTALQSLPKDLPETFDRVLRKLAEKRTTNPATCRKIFAIVAAAQRPLTLDELREATGVVPGDTEWDPRKLINDIQMAVSQCRSLLLIDEEDSTVHFSHHSVKQYIVSSPQDPSTRQFHVELPEADRNLGEVCVTYLNYNVFNTTLTRMGNHAAVQPQAITTAIVERAFPRAAVSKVALKLLKREGGKDFDLSARLQEVGFKERKRENYSFLAYAKSFWLFHTRQFHTRRPATYQLWLGLLSKNDMIGLLPWDPEAWDGQSERVLQWAVENEHGALIYEITSNLCKSNAGLPLRTLQLLIGVETKHLQLYPDIHRCTAQVLAKYCEDYTILSILVDSGLNLYQRDEKGLLISAVLEGRTQVVKALLRRKDFPINNRDGDGMTALNHATVRGDEEMVRLLLSHEDIDVNKSNDAGWTPFKHAVFNGHKEIAKILVDHGANVARLPSRHQISTRGML
ncbi:hypothetical protein Z517_05958 [Fonsecaea pedrosoi CBS 271.37]|uniref:NACHT domain-containing protein n=1 Tax=Fonsecaea pedrosoi CBS 271.37 TaxID=1442368 RepID=A0A0D2DNN2_9EURO|nr:uncharacterized protein Z517_05958 [Fonsecaea pedrosoi CBS 271.37]KIW79346.1 hypothetical protein Z517_05958 [Fonsecaea pedrosoi CBS 271.37]